MKFAAIMFFLLAAAGLRAQVEIKWTPVGPGGGGAQYVPAISPHDDNLMFVSCDMSGVYRSADRGKSWTMLHFDEIRSSRRCGAVFHPSDPDIIYDENYGNWSYHLARSTDAGITWTDLWQMPGAPDDIACLREEPLRIIVAGSFGAFISDDGENFAEATGDFDSESYSLAGHDPDVWLAGAGGVWHSTDRGDSFSKITIDNLDPSTEIADVAVTADAVFVLQSTNLLRSTDGGNNWESILNHSEHERGEFRFVRAEGGYVWISTASGGHYQSSAIRSKDGGEHFEVVYFCNDSWGDVPNLDGDWLSLDFNCGWGGSAIGFNICRTNPEICLWTDHGRTQGTFDCGETWQALFTEFADEEPREAGKRWKSVGLEVTSSWDIYLSPYDEDFVNIAYTDIGGSYSEDGGESWRTTYGGGIPGAWFNTTYDLDLDEETGLLWGAFSGRHDIPGGWSHNYWYNLGSGGVAYSADGGKNWTPLQNGLPDRPVTSLAIDYTSPAESRRIFASVWSHGMWRSDNGGVIWERCSEGLDCGDGTCTNGGPNTHVVEVQVHPSGTVFVLKTKYIRDGSVIKNDAGLWRSDDHGNTWEFISSNVPDCPPVSGIDAEGEHSWADPISFELDPENEDHVYVCAQNCNNGKIQGGLYETTDGGDTWVRILKVYGCYRLTISDYYPDKWYLATVSDGIYITEDKGASWIRDDIFPFRKPTRISEDPNDSSLVWVNTYGGGVWKGRIIDTTASGVAEQIKQGINVYPNPFSERLVIEAPENTRINIHDVYGRELAQFSDTNPVWRPRADALPGVYFVKAFSGKHVIVEKVVLSK